VQSIPVDPGGPGQAGFTAPADDPASVHDRHLACFDPLYEKERQMNPEKGAIGYILLWLLGVPASVLFVIFLLRGCA
jgi:hypothetical protein